MSDHSVNRRTFLVGSAAALVASCVSPPAKARVVGANERISIGVIGCGRRAQHDLMPELYKFSAEGNAEITAVCDVWRQQREKAAARVSAWYERAPRTFVRYQELLALDDVDAVIIASPDHHHAAMLKAAVLAGKDVYCEKPWALALNELNDAVDAVRETDRIVQAGTQLRSWPSFNGCRKLFRSGALGTLAKVEQARNATRPYWHNRVSPVKEADVDWKAFLGDLPDRPFNADQFTAWYGYREFSAGPLGALMCHFVDLVHFITGARFPRSAVSHGGIYAWKDGRTCPDTIATLLEYPEGFLVGYSSNLFNGAGSYTKYHGTAGTLDTSDWNKPFLTGEGAPGPRPIKGSREVEPVECPHHMQNWLQCLRTRRPPNADVQAGYQHAVTSILADMAWVSGRRMVFDAEQRSIRADATRPV